jgi:hypothetical protein
MNQDKKNIVDYIKVSKQYEKLYIVCKVEKIEKDSLDSISSSLVKIVIIGGNVYLR